MFPKGATNPTRVDELSPRCPSVSANLLFALPAKVAAHPFGRSCIESGDDLYPVSPRSCLWALGRGGCRWKSDRPYLFFIALLGCCLRCEEDAYIEPFPLSWWVHIRNVYESKPVLKTVGLFLLCPSNTSDPCFPEHRAMTEFCHHHKRGRQPNE